MISSIEPSKAEFEISKFISPKSIDCPDSKLFNIICVSSKMILSEETISIYTSPAESDNPKLLTARYIE